MAAANRMSYDRGTVRVEVEKICGMAYAVYRARSMTLSFPNRSRSYDDAKRRVRFWGYDSTIEISFFVEAAALCRLDPETRNYEARVLEEFDAGLVRIHEIAAKLYSRHHKGSYVLASADF